MAGFILFTTLMVIMVIALLLLGRMQGMLLYSKAVARQELQHQDFYQLEFVAMKLVNSDPAKIPRSCRREMDEVNAVFQRMKKEKDCLLFEGKKQYLYFIEDLGEKSCLMAEDQQKSSSRHFRYSLVYVKDGSFHSALQLRLIKPGQKGACQGKISALKEGVSSWRYLTQEPLV